jgi:hypothetical protein
VGWRVDSTNCSLKQKNFSLLLLVGVESSHMNKQIHALRIKLASMTDAKKMHALKLKIQQLKKSK